MSSAFNGTSFSLPRSWEDVCRFADVIWPAVKDVVTQMGELSSCLIKTVMDVGPFGSLAEYLLLFQKQACAVGGRVRDKKLFLSPCLR